jgi:hypothetical protein
MTGSSGSGCFANSSVIKDFPALSRGAWRFLFEPINKDQADLSVRTPLNTLKRFSFSDLQIQLACERTQSYLTAADYWLDRA